MVRNRLWRRVGDWLPPWDSPRVPAGGAALGGLFLALAVSEVEDTARGLATFAPDDSIAFLWAFLFGFTAVGLPVLIVQRAALRVLREVRTLHGGSPGGPRPPADTNPAAAPGARPDLQDEA